MTTATLAAPPAVGPSRKQGVRLRSMNLPEFISNEQGGLFRVKVGQHYDNCPNPKHCDQTFCQMDRLAGKEPKRHMFEAYDDYTNDGSGNTPAGFGGYIARCYVDKVEPMSREDYTNDLVESKRDLVLRHNGLGPRGAKFERVVAQSQATVVNGVPQQAHDEVVRQRELALKYLGEKELLALAQEEEIDVADAKGQGGKYDLTKLRQLVVAGW